NLFLLPGHLTTSDLDSQIAISLKIASGIPATKNIPGDLPKILQLIAEKNNIDYLLYDLSPNIGGLNQVLLMSSNYFIIPTSPDYFCYQAISSLGKTIKKWKTEIDQFIFQNDINKDKYSIKNLPKFIGTIQQRYNPRNSMPGKSFQKWIDDIHESINKKFVPELDKINCVIEKSKMDEVVKGTDLLPYDLSYIPDFNYLIAISQRLSKPVFDLTDEEIDQEGKVFGYAAKTMHENRNNFFKIFESLADRVIRLIL
ncbi:MAG: AAA family ATPase, partial [Desulfovibrionaceae bacterium]|nr:AAA family ATPase [Desulfovibrionaceae bacterium]